MKTIIIGLTVMMAGCSGAPRPVAPASVLTAPAVGIVGAPAMPTVTQPIYAHPLSPCPTGCVEAEAPKYLNLRFGPYTVEDYQESKPIILDHDLNVVLIDGWMGTDAGAAFETDAHLEIQAADGSLLYEVQLQHDKHADLVGNVSIQRYVKMALPAGTRFVLFHGPGYSVSGQPLSSLHGDAMFRLYAE